MKLITATVVALTGLGLCATPIARAAGDPFVGHWKQNPNKSVFAGLSYTVRDAGNGNYSFVFGDDVETLTLGKDHLTKFGDTWLISAAGPNAWRWVTKRNGKISSDATWTVSKDGATSIYSSSEMRPDGSTSRDQSKLKRTTAGASGLVGTWVSTSTTIGSPVSMEMAPWENGYSMRTPAYQAQTDFKLDGKAYTPRGPRVAKGTTVSGKKIDDHNFQLTYRLNGKVNQTSRWMVSPNGKSVTATNSYPGESKAQVDAYDRR